jgi:hypothetical protein
MASNIDKVEFIAKALGALNEKVIFVGGAVMELYADNPEISDVRPTKDVDCVADIHIKTYNDYSEFESKLRKLGFIDDTSPKAPIGRKIYKGIEVDFTPINPEILGFGNIWYEDGFGNKIEKTLPAGTKIFILPVEYYVATKFEAMNSRGGTDIRGSHDWEDIVYILDNNGHFIVNFKRCSNLILVEYLKSNFSNLLNEKNIREIIYSALSYGAEEEHIDKIFETLKEICR